MEVLIRNEAENLIEQKIVVSDPKYLLHQEVYLVDRNLILANKVLKAIIKWLKNSLN